MNHSEWVCEMGQLIEKKKSDSKRSFESNPIWTSHVHHHFYNAFASFLKALSPIPYTLTLYGLLFHFFFCAPQRKLSHAGLAEHHMRVSKWWIVYYIFWEKLHSVSSKSPHAQWLFLSEFSLFFTVLLTGPLRTFNFLEWIRIKDFKRNICI